MWVIVLLKRTTAFLLTVFILFGGCFTAYSSSISAESAVVMDCRSKKILFSKNENEKRSVASITKIMTALLAVESGKLNSTVIVDAEKIAAEGSSLGLSDKDRISLKDLVIGMMLTSGNDSANAVACFLGGSIEGFADMMNEKAALLGMKNSHFVTPSGLDYGNHYSTAYDMALLTAAAVKNSDFCDIVSRKSAKISVSGEIKTVYNHNKLLSKSEDIFGVKTGFTEKAGRTLVSAKSYKGNNIIVVTLNAYDDWNDHLKLYSQCEKYYVSQNVQRNISVSVAGGDRDFVKASCKKEFFSPGEITERLYLYPFAYAPVKKGDVIAWMYVYINDELIEKLPVKAEEDVEYYGRKE